jgi:hypothetical protein
MTIWGDQWKCPCGTANVTVRTKCRECGRVRDNTEKLETAMEVMKTVTAPPILLNADYEYAGFRYRVEQLMDGHVQAIPLAGQHPAAAKDKHRRAAIECWEDDGRPS